MNEENKQPESRFKCAECGKAVIVYKTECHRICEHHNAAITAECSATCYGDSSLLKD